MPNSFDRSKLKHANFKPEILRNSVFQYVKLVPDLLTKSQSSNAVNIAIMVTGFNLLEKKSRG